MKPIIVTIMFCFGLGLLSAEDLTISPNDLRIEQSSLGYFLYIRKKPDVNSVLLTESTSDPTYRAASYAWRNPNTPPINIDEKRILNGAVLENKGFFLISSTIVDDPGFGKAFKLFIPWVVEYGYPWARFGVVQVIDGTYVNIKTFAKPFADYTGKFNDNPFTLRVTQVKRQEKKVEKVDEKIPDNYSPEAVKTFNLLSKETTGLSSYSKGPDDTVEIIKKILQNTKATSLDLVICIDTTQSMENDLPPLQKNLVPLLKESLKSIPKIRIGLVQYRDYLEEFLYQLFPTVENLDQVQKNLDRLKARGGRDIPEAVDEALYGALKEFDWQAPTRLLILIGDAPPHLIPLGSITNEMVRNLAKDKKVTINTIVLPSD